MPRAAWIIATVIASVLPAAAGTAIVGSDRETVTSIAAVRAMSDDEVCTQVPVVLRGVATWIHRSADDTLRHLIVQEGDAGVWVNLRTAREGGTWRGDDASLATLASGSIVEIEGATEGGGFSPMITARMVRKVGTAPLPPARNVDMDRFFAGAEDCLRVEVTGVVQWTGGSTDRDLTIDHGGRQFVATLSWSMTSDPMTTLVDARIRLRGVAVSVFNTRGEIMYPRLIVDDPGDVIVDAPPRSEPFEAPQVPLRAIAHFRPEPLDGHRLRTQGIVTYADGDRVIYVQDGLTGVRVETVAAVQVIPGDRIEIAGFLDRRRLAAGLGGSLVRVIATDAPPAPTAISLGEVVKTVRDLHSRGIMARPGDYDGCLVEFPGRLIDVDRMESGGRFTVEVDGLDAPVTVMLDADTFGTAGLIGTGSDLLLRGILQLGNSPLQRANWIPSIDAVSLLVRSAADITVVRGPPWWSVRRLATAAAVLAAVLLGAGTWVLMLRRQVARQATKIAAEMQQRRHAAVEFEAALRERSRLAANLHDTLLQALAGAVLQIDLSRKSLASRVIDKAGDQLDVAKRMVKHAVADLRSAVWSLRTAPQAGRTFRESLLSMLDQFQGEETARVTLDISGEPFEMTHVVAGNLLLVVQEAVRNAIHHGMPRTVRVDVRFALMPRRIEIEIDDDGAGFDPAVITGPEQGHFGLQVMRERIEGLGGVFALETCAGQGTTVTASVDVPPGEAGGGETVFARSLVRQSHS